MDEIIALSPEDRASLFRIVTERKGITYQGLLEKDFWLCWLRKILFFLKNAPDFTSKGGTSLSKGYGIINRFSKDIDITIDRN